MDYDSIDVSNTTNAKAVIKERLIREEGMDEGDADYVISRDYKNLDKFDAEDDEYKDAEKELKFNANRAIKFLKKDQADNRLPESNSISKQEEAARNQKNYEENVKNWKSNITELTNNTIEDFSKLTMDTGKGAEINYELSETDKKILRGYFQSEVVGKVDLAHTEKYFDGQKGSWNVDKMVSDAIWNNSDIRGRVLKKRDEMIRSEGTSAAVDVIKNTKSQAAAHNDTASAEEKQTEQANSFYQKILNR